MNNFFLFLTSQSQPTTNWNCIIFHYVKNTRIDIIIVWVISLLKIQVNLNWNKKQSQYIRIFDNVVRLANTFFDWSVIIINNWRITEWEWNESFFLFLVFCFRNNRNYMETGSRAIHNLISYIGLVELIVYTTIFLWIFSVRFLSIGGNFRYCIVMFSGKITTIWIWFNYSLYTLSNQYVIDPLTTYSQFKYIIKCQLPYRIESVMEGFLLWNQ